MLLLWSCRVRGQPTLEGWESTCNLSVFEKGDILGFGTFAKITSFSIRELLYQPKQKQHERRRFLLDLVAFWAQGLTYFCVVGALMYDTHTVSRFSDPQAGYFTLRFCTTYSES